MSSVTSRPVTSRSWTNTTPGNGNRGAFEVEAESISYVLCRNQGMSPDVGDKSGRYVAGWGNTDPEAVRRSAEHVQKTVKTILGSGRWRNSEGDQP